MSGLHNVRQVTILATVSLLMENFVTPSLSNLFSCYSTCILSDFPVFMPQIMLCTFSIHHGNMTMCNMSGLPFWKKTSLCGLIDVSEGATNTALCNAIYYKLIVLLLVTQKTFTQM